MIRRASLTTSFVLVASTLVACAADSDSSTDDQDVKRGRKVAGYGFDGPKIADALPVGTACPEVVHAVTDACIAARGRDTYTKGCDVLCSVPVASRGRVAGFDFSGFRSDDSLAPMTACPAVADPVTDACIGAGGQTSYTKSCGIVCSLPVAASGKVAGFDFSGYRNADGLAPMTACPQIASPVADACFAKRARTSYAKDCSVLCSVPVAP